MEKFKKWIKRPVNTNFVLFIGIAIFFAVFALLSYKSRTKTTDFLDMAGGLLTEMDDGTVTDVENIGIIFGKIAHGVGKAGNAVLIFVQVYVPLFMAFVTAVQTIFTRLLYSPKAGRLLCYRVFMAFTCISLFVHIVIFSYLLFNFSSFIAMLLADILFLAAFVICIRNTYSKRIIDI